MMKANVEKSFRNCCMRGFNCWSCMFIEVVFAAMFVAFIQTPTLDFSSTQLLHDMRMAYYL